MITRYPTSLTRVSFVSLLVTGKMGSFQPFCQHLDRFSFVVDPPVGNFIGDIATPLGRLLVVEPPEDEESGQEDEEALYHDTHEEDHAVGYTVQSARHHVAEEPAQTEWRTCWVSTVPPLSLCSLSTTEGVTTPSEKVCTSYYCGAPLLEPNLEGVLPSHSSECPYAQPRRRFIPHQVPAARGPWR